MQQRVSGANRNSGILHFESKFSVEKCGKVLGKLARALPGSRRLQEVRRHFSERRAAGTA
jgi:hypothetical protein